jgi:hypothetical protein
MLNCVQEIGGQNIGREEKCVRLCFGKIASAINWV